MWFGKPASGKTVPQLESEIKQLQLQLMTQNDQLETFRGISFKYQEEYNKLVRRVTAFARMLLDTEYAQSQLGGNNLMSDLDVYGLINYAEQKLRTTSSEERALLLSLTEKLKLREQEVEGLKAQISRYLVQEQQRKEYGDVEPTPEPKDGSNEASEPLYGRVAPPADKPKVVEKTSPAAEPKGIMRVQVLDEDDDIQITPPVHNRSNQDTRSKDRPQQGPKPQPPQVEQKQGPVQEKKTPVVSPQPVAVNNSAKAPPAVPTMAVDDDPVVKAPAKPDPQPTASTSSGPAQAAATDPALEQLKEKVSAQNDAKIVAHVVNLNDFMERMTDIMWSIMLAVGKKGLSESKDLKKEVVVDNVTESAFNTALNQLRSMKVINQDKINTGWRWFYTHDLSDIGRRIYLEKFKENPVECEKQALQREHGTALHGYTIKDSATILQAVFGYDDVTTGRKVNHIKLYNNESYIPDIIGKKKVGGLVDYFEVELGHHTQKDFNAKCDKMRMVSKDLYFIVPDADTMNRILVKQIGQWVLDKGGKDKLKGTTVYLTTLTKLNEQKWETIYPF